VQPEGGPALPRGLVQLPGQRRGHHRGQLRRPGQWLPRRQADARHLPASGNLRGGRPDHRRPVSGGGGGGGGVTQLGVFFSHWFRFQI